MKILYAAGNRFSANFQLQRIVENLSLHHTTYTSAYLKSSESIKHIDWILDSFTSNRSLYPKYLEDIKQLAPDIIISDMEMYSAKAAKELGIRLWNCSPIYLLDGIKWKKNQIKYAFTLNRIRTAISLVPKGEKVLVYSPFGDIFDGPKLKDGFEWVRPYHKTYDADYNNSNMAVISNKKRFEELSKVLNLSFNKNITISNGYDMDDSYDKALRTSSLSILTGETGHLSDMIYGSKYIYISPSLDDFETTLNANVCSTFGIGYDLAQIELQEQFAEREVTKILSKNKREYCFNSNAKYLHELLV